jgi:TPP-dependent pyruvate/acetoin dehydrogenase alpha subunit
MSVQPPNAERQIWIYTQMLRVREFEERVKRTFTEHPGVIRGHTHLADGAEASIVGSLSTSAPVMQRSPPIAATAIRWCSAATRRP